MSTPRISDTHPEIERLQLELLRQAPPWKKVYLMDQMYQATKLMALSGLRQRYPNAGPAELRRRLADLMLGPDLAKRAYGPLISDGG